jgi:hypothetical protein
MKRLMAEFLSRILPHPPAVVDERVMRLARLAVPKRTGRPVFVPCQPVEGEAYNECFPIVKAQVERQGGRRVVGWSLWEHPKVMLEAEFHAVWQTPDGNLLDLVPRERSFPFILFLKDTGRAYQGFPLDNLRMALVKDKHIERFIRLQGKKFRLMNQGKLKYQTETVLTGDAALRYKVNEAELEAVCEILCQRYGP